MIYTVTFNPAIDYVIHIKELNCGSILRAESESAYFGGKGINVSLILKELGVKSTAMGFIAGFTGKAIESGIASSELKTDFVLLEEGLTRINVKIRSGEETDINGNGPKISEKNIDTLFERLDALTEGDILVLAGSIPSTLPTDIYERIMKRLSDKGVRFVVDAEKDLLLNALKYKPFLIKPNLEELSAIFDTEIKDGEKALVYAAKLHDMGAANVLVSMGGKGAVLLDENREEHYMKPLGDEFVNSVGAGDSMVAGFIAGWLQEGDYSYALRLGAAAGGATAGSEGLAKKDQILKLL